MPTSPSTTTPILMNGSAKYLLHFFFAIILPLFLQYNVHCEAYISKTVFFLRPFMPEEYRWLQQENRNWKKREKNLFFIFSVWHFICLSLYLFDIVTEFERRVVSPLTLIYWKKPTNRNVISHSSNPVRSLHARRKENLTKKNSFYFWYETF